MSVIPIILPQSCTGMWLTTIQDILAFGSKSSPRDQTTTELHHPSISVDMRMPVLLVPERKLSYQFMAAEAYWILTGDSTVAGIEKYNKHITQFSDNGTIFFGAYGPKIVNQVDYVVVKLKQDRNSRQAGLTIWRENPPMDTKDVPCTVAIFFSIRDHRLNCHVFMRSSDAWLGLPYDVFNFSMLAHYVCAKMNEGWSDLSPGTLYLTAANMHIYERDLEGVRTCLKSKPLTYEPAKTPSILYTNPALLLQTLKDLRDTKPGSDERWWES